MPSAVFSSLIWWAVIFLFLPNSKTPLPREKGSKVPQCTFAFPSAFVRVWMFKSSTPSEKAIAK